MAEAEQVLEAAMKQAPDDMAIVTELAKVKGRLGEGPAAVGLFEQVAKAVPQSADAHLNLALSLADIDQMTLALQEATRAVEIAPRSGDAHAAKGMVLYGSKRLDEAAAEFAKATTCSPSLANAWYYWAMSESQKGNGREAARLAQKVVELQPRNVQAYSLLAKSLSQLAMTKEASEAWKRAIELNPDDEQMVYVAAHAIRLTDPAESKRLMDRFLLLNRQREASTALVSRVSTLGNQANIAMQQEDWPHAIALFRKAIDECGQCKLLGDLHKNLGLTACHQGDLETGKNELDQALALKPADRDIVAALAWVESRRHLIPSPEAKQ